MLPVLFGANRVRKTPAGVDARLPGVAGLQFILTDLENGSLNMQVIKSFRHFNVSGDLVWGARTAQGNDQVQQGAFQGATPQRAYFIKCDLENLPQSSSDQAVIHVLMGFAPAEGMLTTRQGTARKVRLMGFEVLGR
jgi:hypothetical protein